MFPFVQSMRGILPAMVLVGIVNAAVAANPTELTRVAALRHPVGIVSRGNALYVANGRSGTISIVESSSGQVVSETAIARQLSDLGAGPWASELLAVDPQRGELLLLKADARRISIEQRLPVSRFPVTVCVSSRHSLCAVASLWSRRLTLVGLESAFEPGALRMSRLHQVASIDLPFAPREQCLIDDERRLVVADAFGGHLAIIDLAGLRLESVCAVEGHNIRGLLWEASDRQLLIAQQLLDEQLPTTESHVSWGGIVSNVVRSVPLEELLPRNGETNDLRARRLTRWNIVPIGGPERAGADPGRMLRLDGDRLVVALGGVGEIAVRLGKTEPFFSLPAGERPVALAADSDSERRFVASAFDDSVSIWNTKDLSPIGKVSLGPRPPLSAADRGERLFYDGKLSHRRWFSCHSCHPDGHTNGRLNDNLGDGGYGSPRRIPTLLGTAATGPWAWDGHHPMLIDQIRSSLLTTMHGGKQAASERRILDLAAYLHTLPAPPALSTARGTADLVAVERGRVVFEDRGCSRCHAPPDYTSPHVYDVGLHDSLLQGAQSARFNPPSLLGVSQRGPYFHDNRAATLSDVFERFHHGDTADLPATSLADLLAFLQAL